MHILHLFHAYYFILCNVLSIVYLLSCLEPASVSIPFQYLYKTLIFMNIWIHEGLILKVLIIYYQFLAKV